MGGCSPGVSVLSISAVPWSVTFHTWDALLTRCCGAVFCVVGANGSGAAWSWPSRHDGTQLNFLALGAYLFGATPGTCSKNEQTFPQMHHWAVINITAHLEKEHSSDNRDTYMKYDDSEQQSGTSEISGE